MFIGSSSVSTIGSRLARTVGCGLAALVGPVGLLTGVVGGAPAAHAATPATVTFAYPQTGSFVAPGPGTLTMTATGGSGHSGIDTVYAGDDGGNPVYGGSGGAGGAGEMVTETLPVTPGEQFDAYPGAAAGGAGGPSKSPGSPPTLAPTSAAETEVSARPAAASAGVAGRRRR